MTNLSAEQNPYLVLELERSASGMEIERAAQRLLGLLELGSSSAQRYPTPWGERPRDSQLVRVALTTLRDPSERLNAALWAPRLGGAKSQFDELNVAQGGEPFDFFASIGWRGRWEGL